jgi:hypothetical protein
MQHSHLRQNLKRFAWRTTICFYMFNDTLFATCTNNIKCLPLTKLEKQEAKVMLHELCDTQISTKLTFEVFCSIVNLRVQGWARGLKFHTRAIYQCSYNIQKIWPIWSLQLGFMYRAVPCQFCCITNPLHIFPIFLFLFLRNFWIWLLPYTSKQLTLSGKHMTKSRTKSVLLWLLNVTFLKYSDKTAQTNTYKCVSLLDC